MGRTINYTETLEVEVCWCGVNHAIPAMLARAAREEGKAVYCPLGHQWVVRENEAVRERKRRERAEAEAARLRARLDQETASHRATKGQLTKAKNRAAKGVCPAPGCKRSFVDVARHVKTCHPDLATEEK